LGTCCTAASFEVATDVSSRAGDDIGWADFNYNNGTAATPRVNEWIKEPGTVVFQDFHTGGTVCSPTRATVLTGRNHFRDCVNYVYGCSDMTECVPDFEFAPQRTFTIADAARATTLGEYTSHFGGKVRAAHIGFETNPCTDHTCIGFEALIPAGAAPAPLCTRALPSPPTLFAAPLR
jgi:hypothetical protein